MIFKSGDYSHQCSCVSYLTSKIVCFGDGSNVFRFELFQNHEDGGIIHYVLNCFAFFYIGKAVEQSHGTIPTTILFIVPAVGSVLVSAIFLPQFISVGSSGGMFYTLFFQSRHTISIFVSD